jgi:hypothetical protein
MTQRVDYERYARANDTAAWNAVIMRAHKLRERTLIEAHWRPDGRQHKRVRIVPDVPDTIVPEKYRPELAGRGIWYDEVTLYDPRERSADVTIESPAGERVRARGLARCIERDGGVLMCFEGEVSVKLVGMGAMIEKLVVAEVQRRYLEVGQLLQDFLDRGLDRD